jgi:hypothetical protein
MSKILLFLAAFILLSYSCNTKSETQEENSFSSVFIQSIKENKFELLGSSLADKNVYNAISPNKEVSDSFINDFLVKNKEKIKEGWGMIAATAKEKKIDFTKLKIKDWLVFQPFRNKEKDIKGGVLVYEYDGKTWDDLMFLVGIVNGKTHLLEIPNPTRAFSFSDTSLHNISDAKLYNDLADSTYKTKVQDRVKELIDYAKENKIELVTANTVYSGDDESRRWRSAMNPSDAKELEKGSELVKQINSIMESCTTTVEFDSLDYERESEGVWVVQKMKCGRKIIYFAFLKIGSKLLLGEVNAEDSALN